MWFAWLLVAAAHVLDGKYSGEVGGFRGGLAAMTKDTVLEFLKAHAPTEREDILEESAELTSSARSRPYTQSVPDDIFKEYVAPPTVLDEPQGKAGMRSHLRSLVDPILEKAQPKTVGHAAESVFMELGPKVKLKFISNSTPQIMSPQAVLEHGGASCTGLSIFFVDALRSAGIPARVAGTPYWHGDTQDGNHDWIEVYTGREGCKHHDLHCDGWSFIEAPFQGNLTREALHRPCENWFCTPEKIGLHSGTETYATRFVHTDVLFPMTWNANATGKTVYAEKRSEYYAHACGSCGFDSY